MRHKQVSPDKKRVKDIHAAASRFAAFLPAREVLTVVRSVPTWFVQFDHAVRVGGWPLGRFSVVHGPSGAGKTYFILGLIGSFLGRGHRALFVDLERTTPITWVETAIGKELASSEKFSSIKNDTLEEMRGEISNYLQILIEAKEAGEIPADESALIVLDSLDKIRTKHQFDILQKESAEEVGMDGMRGRAGMVRAQLIKSWLDELIPLLEKAGAAMVFIARETVDPNADSWSRKFGNDYKIGGGKHVYYDSSLVVRVESAGAVLDERTGQKVFLGDRHRVTIRKTKVAGKEDRQTSCHFFTRGGKDVDGGFDRARDILEIARKFGVVDQSFSWGKKKLGRSEHAAVKFLADDAALLAALEKEVRVEFEKVEPTSYDTDGVIE